MPSAADVYVRPYRGDMNAWLNLGKTPLQKMRVPRDDYVWRIVKPGFAPVLFIGRPPGLPPPGAHSSFDLRFKLHPVESVPRHMVVVTGDSSVLAPLSTRPPWSESTIFLSIDMRSLTKSIRSSWMLGVTRSHSFGDNPL